MIHRSALTWLHVSGNDARAFLHSQITGDCRTLKVGEALFTGYCQAQGRLLATMLFACIAEENGAAAFALILPKSMLATTQTRLQKFIMRSKVKLVQGDGAVLQSPQPFTDSNINPAAAFEYLGSHWALIPASAMPTLPLAHTAELSDEFEINQGLVWITPATIETFVPQMIGLDTLGGVSFNKGCYPGQEVVARLHYLGKSKRGLYRAHINVHAPAKLDETLLGQNVVDASGKILGSVCAIAPPHQALVVLGHEHANAEGRVLAEISGQTTLLAELRQFTSIASAV